ncbi:MAG: FAD-dependent oxidoreductase [Lentisphaerae bacterium]|nr:FAD-dependent oxidoreductase [Lentisphaerota bacterium]
MTHLDPPPFPFRSLEQLRAEVEQQAPALPIDDDLEPLSRPLVIGAHTLPNRFCVLPLEGADAEADGAPGPLTIQRYTDFARGGAGLIWMEATAVAEAGRSQAAQLWLHERNVNAFTALASRMRTAARERFGHDVCIIIQLTHAAGECTDAYLERLTGHFVSAAALAEQAGFDGVDIKSCHDSLGAALLAGTDRAGDYGGSFENRTHFLRDTVTRVRSARPNLLLATRLSVHDPVYHPCGIPAAEAQPLVAALMECGLDLLNLSASDTYNDPSFTTPTDHHPLAGLAHAIEVVGDLQSAFPKLPIVSGGGFSRLGAYLPVVAAGVIRSGRAALIGLGRAALAYPELPADTLEQGAADSTRCCISCGACSTLYRSGGPTGCVINDPDRFGAAYRHQRRFGLDHLTAEAKRCHQCASAPCTTASPNRLDVPAFIKAFAEGDIARSYAILKHANPLPELCSHLTPTGMFSEGACVEATLSGNPIPITDIQYTVAWLGREAGYPGLSLPDHASGRRVAIVGGGPTGIACATALLERGHHVTLIERDAALGGTPRTLIPARRLPDPQPEIDALLAPAIAAERLTVRLGEEIGRALTLEALSETHDAILLATGLWQERSLGAAEGVMDALRFLRETKAGTRTTVPPSVAVLAGDDCAMDAAATAQALGTKHLYIIFSGPRSAMHWHKDEAWFKSEGVHCLPLTKPLGYEADTEGRLTGLRVARTLPASCADEINTQRPTPNVQRPIMSSHLDVGSWMLDVGCCETILPVELVIEALLLEPEDSLSYPHADNLFTAGGMLNGGATVAQCIAEGREAAATIHRAIM